MRRKSYLARVARRFRLSVYRRGYVRLYRGTLRESVIDVIGQVPRDTVADGVVRRLVQRNSRIRQLVRAVEQLRPDRADDLQPTRNVRCVPRQEGGYSVASVWPMIFRFAKGID